MHHHMMSSKCQLTTAPEDEVFRQVILEQLAEADRDP